MYGRERNNELLDKIDKEIHIHYCIQRLTQTYKVFIYLRSGKKSESESFSVTSYSLQPHGLYSPLNYLGQTYTVHGMLQARILEGVGLSLLQGIFPTQGSNPGLLH